MKTPYDRPCVGDALAVRLADYPITTDLVVDMKWGNEIPGIIGEERSLFFRILRTEHDGKTAVFWKNSRDYQQMSWERL